MTKILWFVLQILFSFMWGLFLFLTLYFIGGNYATN